MSPDEVVTALTQGNTISPSGNMPIGDKYPIVPVNSMVKRRRASWAAFRSAPARTAGLPPRRRLRSQDAADIADRLRAGQRPAGGLHPGDEAGRRLDAERGQRTSSRPCPRCRRVLPRRHQGQLRVRPVAVRHAGRCAGVVIEGAAGRDARRADGAAVPARLAERDRRRAEHPAGADGVGRRPVAHRPDDQPDDARRPGAGGRHPRR